jgi:hypothetical protein
MAESTNQFLTVQVEDARRSLAEQEKKLELYRERHAGELPSQADSNLQVVQNTQMQLHGASRVPQQGSGQAASSWNVRLQISAPQKASRSSSQGQDAPDQPAAQQLGACPALCFTIWSCD